MLVIRLGLGARQAMILLLLLLLLLLSILLRVVLLFFLLIPLRRSGIAALLHQPPKAPLTLGDAAVHIAHQGAKTVRQLGLDVELAGVEHAVEFHSADEGFLVLIDGVDIGIVATSSLSGSRGLFLVAHARTARGATARRAGRSVAVSRSLTSVALDAASAVAPPQSTAAAAGRGGIMAARGILGRVAHVDGGIARGIGATVLGVLGVATVVGGGGGADGVGYGTIVGVAAWVGTTMRRALGCRDGCCWSRWSEGSRCPNDDLLGAPFPFADAGRCG